MTRGRIAGVFLGLLVAAGLGALSAEVAAEEPAAEPPPGWVTLGDPEFCAEYLGEATGTQVERSRFAWRLFARLNQPTTVGGGSEIFSAWETWASNTTTFPKEGPPLGPPSSRKGPVATASVKRQIDVSHQEERTRNDTAYEYIVYRKLYDAAATMKLLGEPTGTGGPQIDFPVGSIETKAAWTTQGSWAELTGEQGLPLDMYTIVGDEGTRYGLLGLHIMAKIQTSPDGPRQMSDTSWFWTTFEYYRNPDRKYLIGFVTYPDKLTYAEQKELLHQAGLGSSAFAKQVEIPVFDAKTGETTTVTGNNYVSNGTQFRFMGPHPKTGQEVNVVLGNSALEGDFVINSPPGAKNPYRGWNSSCHSCHFEAAGNQNTLTKTFHAVTGNVILGNGPEGKPMHAIDFEWSIPLLAK